MRLVVASAAVLAALPRAHAESPVESQLSRRLQTTAANSIPTQTYFVPLPEEDMDGLFERLQDRATFTEMNSLTSVAVAAAGTILWYDHWEDGYEVDVTNPLQTSTMIYGDNNMANGCIKDIVGTGSGGCTADSDDYIESGTAVLFTEDTVRSSGRSFPPDTSNPPAIKFDGRDRIQSSFPIALTRGGYPETTVFLKTYLAGAVEIMEASNYGTSFRVPVGTDTPDPNSQDYFEMTEVHIMAAEDGTDIYRNGALMTASGSLRMGETYIYEGAKEGDTFTSSKPVQVDLITGDVRSDYEMRWYSLLSTNLWYHDYYTPVSTDGTVKTVVYLFNPQDSTIQVTFQNTGSTQTVSVSPGDSKEVTLPGRGSGSRFYTASEDTFFALTVTDAGRTYDWGHPLIPANLLSSQALVGWGYGCTENDCDSSGTRSVIWVTPVKDATIYIDLNGDKTANLQYDVNALGQKIVVDAGDDDMTGAVLWALDSNDESVDIAVAWGQLPSYSKLGDADGLDMGTVIMPLPEISASKVARLVVDENQNKLLNPGDTLEYTIVVTNTGRIALNAGSFVVKDFVDPLFDQTAYVPGTSEYTDQEGTIYGIPDLEADSFPLEAGVATKADLPVDAIHNIKFRVTVNDIASLTSEEVHNSGRLEHNSGELTNTFEVKTPIYFEAEIDIETTVYGGHDNGAQCTAGSSHPDLYQGTADAPLTYCFVITNTGDTYLDEIEFTKGGTGTIYTDLFLAPGESATFYEDRTISSDSFEMVGNVEGVATLSSGTALDMPAVMDSDPAEDIRVVSNPPTGSPTSLPTSGPTGSPTSLQTAGPTSAPVTTGIDITEIDLCKNFSQYFDMGFEIEHFAFLAHTKACVNAKVYYRIDSPLGQDEVDSAQLDSDWTLMCDANVQGNGIGAHTMIGAEHCSMVTVQPGETVHFYVAMEYIDQSTCDGLGAGSAIVGYEIATIWSVYHQVCPAQSAP